MVHTAHFSLRSMSKLVKNPLTHPHWERLTHPHWKPPPRACGFALLGPFLSHRTGRTGGRCGGTGPAFFVGRGPRLARPGAKDLQESPIFHGKIHGFR